MENQAVEGSCFQAGPGLVKTLYKRAELAASPQLPLFPSSPEPTFLQVPRVIPFASLNGDMNKLFLDVNTAVILQPVLLPQIQLPFL